MRRNAWFPVALLALAACSSASPSSSESAPSDLAGSASSSSDQGNASPSKGESPEAPTGTQKSDLELRRTLGVVLFDGFEALDAFGPIEMFSYVGPGLNIVTVAETSTVKSVQGNVITVDATFANAPDLDLIMVPGGKGSVTEMVIGDALLDFVKTRSQSAELILSVCTGAHILARAGVLDGRRATSNKLFWTLARTAGLGHDVTWVPKARWVVDGNRWTSSGVSAGTDMALAVIQQLWGDTMANTIANSTEWIWQKDPENDPFAVK